MKLSRLAAAWLVALSGSAVAADIPAFDNGWYSSVGAHNSANSNIYTGDVGVDTRSFFAFDITGGTEASAISITFYSNGVFATDTGTESIGLYDYLGPVSSLVAGGGGVAAYYDLGSGSLLGEHSITAPDGSRMPQFTVQLSSAFVSQYNAVLASAEKRIALGAAMTSPHPIGGPAEAFWSFSEGIPAAYLTVTSAVPEPASWVVLIAGFGLVGGAMRYRRRPADAPSAIVEAGTA